MIEFICGQGYQWDWTAMSAWGTLLAVVVALAAPYLQRAIDVKRDRVRDARELKKMKTLLLPPLALMRAQLAALEGETRRFASLLGRHSRSSLEIDATSLASIVERAELFPDPAFGHLLDLYAWGLAYNVRLDHIAHVDVHGVLHVHASAQSVAHIGHIRRLVAECEGLYNWLHVDLYGIVPDPLAGTSEKTD